MKHNGIIHDPIPHTYTNGEDKHYKSVTSFVKLFEHPYDEDFWLTYKAVSLILGDVAHKPLKLQFLKLGGSYREEAKQWYLSQTVNLVDPYQLEERKLVVKESWNESSDKSLKKGSDKHDLEEKRVIRQHGRFDSNGVDISTLEPGVYPELNVYIHRYMLAGRLDYCKIYKDKSFDIVDYKTNKKEKFTFSSWENPFTKEKQFMFPPFNKFEQCAMSTYTVQVSLYALCLEDAGFKFKKGKIKHFYEEHFSLNSKKTKFLSEDYPIHYCKKECVEALEMYKDKNLW